MILLRNKRLYIFLLFLFFLCPGCVNILNLHPMCREKTLLERWSVVSNEWISIPTIKICRFFLSLKFHLFVCYFMSVKYPWLIRNYIKSFLVWMRSVWNCRSSTIWKKWPNQAVITTHLETVALASSLRVSLGQPTSMLSYHTTTGICIASPYIDLL